MAKFFAYLVIILVILSNEVFHTDGRKLVARENSSNVVEAKHVPNPKELGKNRFRLDDEGYMDSYRPTRPGNSPGIGHSKHD